MKLTTTQVALLEAIKASLFDIEPNFPADTDWDEVVKEAKAQTVLGIISPVIPVKDVSVEKGKATYMRILFEQDKLIKLLDANDIPCVILKGAAAAQYYPKPYLRAMGDVDFLVPHDKFVEAVALLESNGYVYHHGKTQDGKIPEQVRHIGYLKNGIEFELHHHFSTIGFNIDDILEQAIAKREYRLFEGYKISVLPDYENGLVLLGHINIHLKENQLGLRQMIDWSMYVHTVLDDKTWNNNFAIVANNVGLDKLAVNTTQLCKNYLGLPNKNTWYGINERDLSLEYLNVIFSDGNFGRKALNSSIKYGGRIPRAVYGIRKNGLYRYFKDIGLNKSNICKRYSCLKTFACLFGIIIFIKKGIMVCISHQNVRDQINEGNRRYELYEKIGVRYQ